MIDGSHGNNDGFACLYDVWHATFIFREANHIGNPKPFLSIIAIRFVKVNLVNSVVLTECQSHVLKAYVMVGRVVDGNKLVIRFFRFVAVGCLHEVSSIVNVLYN